MGIITSIAATVLLLYCFALCKERVPAPPTESLNIKTDVLKMFKNRAWNVASGFALLNFIRFGALLSVTPYFAINVLKQPWMRKQTKQRRVNVKMRKIIKQRGATYQKENI